MKTKIHKGDIVKVFLGKDRGKEGKVARVLTKAGKVVVEGVNTYKRHVRKTGNIEGGIIDIVKPIDISNVAIICPNCNQPTRVGFSIRDEQKIRICKKCQKEIKTKGK